MSRVVVINHVTLDGVMQAPGRPDEDRRGGFEHGGWATPGGDDVMGAAMGARMAESGGLLFGRRTYEDLLSYWNTQPDSPFTEPLNEARKFVASRTLREPLPWGNSTLLEGDAADAVADLKEQAGPDLHIMGSGELIQSLLRRALIDEYMLMIHPLVLGTGRQLFPDGTAPTTLRLVDSNPTTTGVVIVTYRPVEPTAPASASSIESAETDVTGGSVRKLIVSNIVSLDGYFEGPGGNVMALPMDGFFDEHNLERLRAADTLLLGAKTYRALKGYWPAVAENPEASPAVAANPELADLHRETGRRNNEIRKVVVSDSLTSADTAPWTETTRIVRRGDARRVVAELKEEPGKEILMFGSRTLWNDLLRAELIDELHLMLGASVLGDGTPTFAPGPPQSLRLVDSRRREGSDNLLLRYEVADRDGNLRR